VYQLLESGYRMDKPPAARTLSTSSCGSAGSLELQLQELQQQSLQIAEAPPSSSGVTKVSCCLQTDAPSAMYLCTTGAQAKPLSSSGGGGQHPSSAPTRRRRGGGGSTIQQTSIVTCPASAAAHENSASSTAAVAHMRSVSTPPVDAPSSSAAAVAMDSNNHHHHSNDSDAASSASWLQQHQRLSQQRHRRRHRHHRHRRGQLGGGGSSGATATPSDTGGSSESNTSSRESLHQEVLTSINELICGCDFLLGLFPLTAADVRELSDQANAGIKLLACYALQQEQLSRNSSSGVPEWLNRLLPAAALASQQADGCLSDRLVEFRRRGIESPEDVGVPAMLESLRADFTELQQLLKR
uniref:CG2258 n=1 Tax=Macrostomum lignano TaxID=282301 RepID=A0A1I8IWU0_9PLAT